MRQSRGRRRAISPCAAAIPRRQRCCTAVPRKLSKTCGSRKGGDQDAAETPLARGTRRGRRRFWRRAGGGEQRQARRAGNGERSRKAVQLGRFLRRSSRRVGRTATYSP